jgi:hypothetical protein
VTPETQHWLRVTSVLGPELLASPWLRRLAGISFLGTLDRHPRSHRPSNRYQHSLAVASLGLRAAEDLALEGARRRTFVAACLLHDIGHFPLSHAGEKAFARKLGLDHHGMGRAVILGIAPLDHAASLAPALEAIGIAPAEVWAIIDGEAPDDGDPALHALSWLLRAPINLDTLDGIPRAAHTFALSHGRAVGERVEAWASAAPSERLPGKDRLFAWSSGETDDFWRLKDRVYAELIERPANVLAEARLVQAIEALPLDGILEALVGFDDEALRRLLRDAGLDVLVDARDDDTFALRKRRPEAAIAERSTKRYRVDDSVTCDGDVLSLATMRRRYRHDKERGWIVVRRPHEQLSLPGLGDLTRAHAPRLPTVEAPEL